MGIRKLGAEVKEPLWEENNHLGVYQQPLPEVADMTRPMAGEGRTTGQHQITDHGSTEASPEPQNNRDPASPLDEPRCWLFKEYLEISQHLTAWKNTAAVNIHENDT